jgi:hypothetical protein
MSEEKPPPGRIPDRKLITWQEACNWLAFRYATNRDLTGYAGIAEKWGTLPWKDGGHSLVHAFEAVIGGSADLLERERAAMQERRHGRPTTVLLAELREELAEYKDHKALYEAAEIQLAELRAIGKLTRNPEGWLWDYYGGTDARDWCWTHEVRDLHLPAPKAEAEAEQSNYTPRTRYPPEILQGKAESLGRECQAEHGKLPGRNEWVAHLQTHHNAERGDARIAVKAAREKLSKERETAAKKPRQ